MLCVQANIHHGSSRVAPTSQKDTSASTSSEGMSLPSFVLLAAWLYIKIVVIMVCVLYVSCQMNALRK